MGFLADLWLVFFFREKPYYDNCFWNEIWHVSSWNTRRETGQSRIPPPCFLSCGTAAAVELHAAWQKWSKSRIRLGEQRDSFSPLWFFNPAYKMTAGMAVRCWCKREGQQGTVISCGGNFLQQQCRLPWNTDFIGSTRYHPRTLQEGELFLLNHKHCQHIFVISHCCTTLSLAFGSNSVHSTLEVCCKVLCCVCSSRFDVWLSLTVGCALVG